VTTAATAMSPTMGATAAIAAADQGDLTFKRLKGGWRVYVSFQDWTCYQNQDSNSQ